MASLFTHVLVGVAVSHALLPSAGPRLWWYAAIASVLPDLDVIGFPLGIAYDEPLGHRGLSHSLLAAAIIGIVFAWRTNATGRPVAGFLPLTLLLTAITASHGLLDAMTNGGLGIAFFSPFDYGRYFLPWTPIEVSPIGVTAFFSDWGLQVLRSEVLSVWLPVGAFWLIAVSVRARRGPAGSRLN